MRVSGVWNNRRVPHGEIHLHSCENRFVRRFCRTFVECICRFKIALKFELHFVI